MTLFQVTVNPNRRFVLSDWIERGDENDEDDLPTKKMKAPLTKGEENQNETRRSFNLVAKMDPEGEIEVHMSNIKVYQTMPAGIGEHSDS